MEHATYGLYTYYLMAVNPDSLDIGVYLSKTKIMASGPTTSRQIDRERMESVTDFIFLGSKVTVDGDCSHEVRKT